MADQQRPLTHPQHPPLPSSNSARSKSYGAITQDGNAFSTRGQRLPQIIQNSVRYRYSDSPRRTSNRTSGDSWVDQEGDVEQAPIISRSRTVGDQIEQRVRVGRASVGEDGGGNDPTAVEVLLPETPLPPSDFPLAWTKTLGDDKLRLSDRRVSVLLTPQMRSQRLIGASNPKYRWETYYKSEDELKCMSKRLRKYYQRNNYLIIQYLYIDKLLDSSLPQHLIQEYHQQAPQRTVNIPPTIGEETSPTTKLPQGEAPSRSSDLSASEPDDAARCPPRIKRTKSIYKVEETSPLLSNDTPHLPDGCEIENQLPAFQIEEDTDSSSRAVTIAIALNFSANAILLILKIIVTVLTSSVSVLASLVDGALDFLCTTIVWTTTRLASRRSPRDQYPVGRHRLEPIGILVFSVIMITSFVQVALEALNRLASPDRTVVRLSPAALAIMAATVLVKGLCWFWCRLVRNSSVQALAQDAVTDCLFNSCSILFPLVGHFARRWWLDPLGGLLLAAYVILSWGLTTRRHVRNLVGRAAHPDERNILLYLTMRFARSIRRIQNIAAYHVGDRINVEVDIILDEDVIGGGSAADDDVGLKPGARALRDIHDLGESLQYVLESVPGVERAFVHADYWEGNLPSHMDQ